jgi:drug/metabolite transporter (DMT)-like permease
VMPVLAVVRRGRGLLRVPWSSLTVGFVGGLVSLAAYGLVLVAQTSGATAAVAALRETSIVIGAVIGTLFLGERFGWRRTVAAAVVVVGIVLVDL